MLYENSIFVSGLGYRNPRTEYDQIIWYWNNTERMYKTSALKTRYWLDIKEHFKVRLLVLQAFELLEFLESKAGIEKEKRREAWRKKAKETAAWEAEALKDWYENYKTRRKLIDLGRLN